MPPACIVKINNGRAIYETTTPAVTPPNGDGVYTADNSPPIGTFPWIKPKDVNGFMEITYALAMPKAGVLIDIPQEHDISVAVNMAYTTIGIDCMLKFVQVPYTSPDCADVTICFNDGSDPIFVANPSAMWYTYFPKTKPQGVFASVANLKYIYGVKSNGGLLVDGQAPYDINEVLRHELRHSVGLVHTQSPSDLMYPFYHEQRRPSAMDIYQEQFMYGPRVPPVNPVEVDALYNYDASSLEFS